jgi:hypothetical protein
MITTAVGAVSARTRASAITGSAGSIGLIAHPTINPATALAYHGVRGSRVA